MGHLIRIRDLLRALSEKTEWDLPPRRKQQLAYAVETAEKVKAKLDELAEEPGILGILARALSLNIAHYIETLKATRFLPKP